jgi:hypothetical protein
MLYRYDSIQVKASGGHKNQNSCRSRTNGIQFPTGGSSVICAESYGAVQSAELKTDAHNIIIMSPFRSEPMRADTHTSSYSTVQLAGQLWRMAAGRY